jgi:hypothetical protein
MRYPRGVHCRQLVNGSADAVARARAILTDTQPPNSSMRTRRSLCAQRFRTFVMAHFKPSRVHVEYPSRTFCRMASACAGGSTCCYDGGRRSSSTISLAATAE